VGARLLLLLKPSEPDAVRAAAVGALAAATTRAGEFAEVAPAARREAAALLARAVPLLLADVASKPGGALAAPTLRLLHAAASGSLASSLRPHAEAAEAAAVAAVLSPPLQLLGCRLVAALPRVPGDAAAWSSMTRRIMLAAHATLDAALRGAEAQSAAVNARGALEAPGEAVAKPLVPHTSGPLDAAAGATQAQAWLRCLACILVLPFPMPVPVPGAALVCLVGRVLAADGSMAAAGRVAPAALMAIPTLQVDALDVLGATLSGAGRAALLQEAPAVTELLRAALRAGAAQPCEAGVRLQGEPAPTAPILRAAVYAAAATFIGTMGAAFAVELAPQLAAAAGSDLAVPRDAPVGVMSEAGAGANTGSTGSRKKRKAGDNGLDDLGSMGAAAHTAGPAARLVSLACDGAAGSAGFAVRAAALACLSALYGVAGGFLSEHAREAMDQAVATAAEACVAAWPTSTAALAEQDAALDCLLASVLAPRPCRPPHLPVAVALFGRCALRPAASRRALSALAALEALALPVAAPRIWAETRDTIATANESDLVPTRPLLFGSLPAPAARVVPASLAVLEPTPGFGGEVAPLPPAQVAARSVLPSPSPQQPIAAALPPSVPSAAPAAEASGRAYAAVRRSAPQPALGDASSDSEGPLPDIVLD